MVLTIIEAALGLLLFFCIASVGFTISGIFGIILYPLGFIIGSTTKRSTSQTSTPVGYYYTQPGTTPVQPNLVQNLQTQSSSIWNTSSTSSSYSKNWFSQTQTSSTSASNSFRTVYDLDGNPLQLGTRDEKASGGEGTVYTMPNTPGIMIKLYKPQTIQNAVKMREIQKRLDCMIHNSACAGMKYLAWPLLIVADDKKEMNGFAMRACKGESFRALGSVAGITKAFPGWTRLQLAETALDFVAKVHALAKNNVIINDFNPSNFLVDRNCKVSMIDCDSYQIPDRNGNPLITHTYFASHVAPELLKNQKLMDSPRDIHHVEFGTAVVVFGLVMCGLHPYSFSDPSNHIKIGMPEENLLKGHCPFAPGSKLNFPKAPHDEWANLWSWLPTSLQDAFVATFCDGHSNPSRRTFLDQLESALRETVQFMQSESKARELMPRKRKP